MTAAGPILLCRSAAARLCGVSPKTFDKLVRAGTMPGPVELEPLARRYWHRGQVQDALDKAAGIVKEARNDREARRQRHLRENPQAGL